MKLNVPALQRLLKRALSGKHIDLLSLAKRTWTVCPEQTVTIPKAVFLDGALDKITGLSPWRTWEGEKPLLHGGELCHHATTGYLLQNVEIVDAHLYCDSARMSPGFGKEKFIRSQYKCKVEIDEASLETTQSGSHFFGPYLMCDIPMTLLLPQNARAIALVTKPYEHASGYRELLNIENSDLLSDARIKELTMFTDYAQNKSKVERYQILRRRMHDSLTKTGLSISTSSIIYLRRGSGGEERKLENEDDIVAYLSGIGTRIIDTDLLTAKEIAEQTFNANIVISIEGSHLSHVIYSASDNFAFLVIQPPDRFALAYKEFSDCMKMHFAFVVGTKSSGGFTVDCDEVKKMLDILDNQEGLLK